MPDRNKVQVGDIVQARWCNDPIYYVGKVKVEIGEPGEAIRFYFDIPTIFCSRGKDRKPGKTVRAYLDDADEVSIVSKSNSYEMYNFLGKSFEGQKAYGITCNGIPVAAFHEPLEVKDTRFAYKFYLKGEYVGCIWKERDR